MARPALDPAFKASRLASARREASRLNRKTPENVYAFATPHGRVYVRYEPPVGLKTILRSPFPSIEFDEELLALRKGIVPARPQPARQAEPVADKKAHGTWRWLCESYFNNSTEFKGYTARDQRVRRGVLERTWAVLLEPDDPSSRRFGDMPVPYFTTKAIYTLRNRFGRIGTVPDKMFPEHRGSAREEPTTPEAGNSAVRYIRLVLEWALQEHTDLVGGRNWAKEVKLFPPGSGHKTWGAEQCAAFEKVHVPGTQMRLIYDIAKTTGQRVSDVARLGYHMIKPDHDGHGMLRFVQTKGRRRDPVTAYVPMFPELRSALDAAKRSGVLGESVFITTPGGREYKSTSLTNLFRDGCKAAGLHGYSMHGLRKTGVVNLIRAGCSIHEIMAITGHRSRKEIERYGREYLRESAAEGAIKKWLAQQELETSFTPDIGQAA